MLTIIVFFLICIIKFCLGFAFVQKCLEINYVQPFILIVSKNALQ